MENETANAKKFILNYGLLLGILMVVLGVLMYVTNYYLDPHWAFMVVSFLIFVSVVVLGIKAFKKENGGFLRLGEAIKVGVGIALIAGILSAIWTLLLSSVIEPDFMNQMADLQREQMMERFPDLTDQQLEDAMEMNAPFRTPWVSSAISLVGNLLFGLIVGLVAGLIMKQKRPYED